MNTLTTTLMASAVASLMAFPVLAQEAQTEEPTRSEFNYRYENTQGALEGDRDMQRDRDQVRLQTQDPEATEDPLQTRDQVRLQDGVEDPDPLKAQDRTRQQDRIHDPETATDQSLDSTQDQKQTRSRLMRDRTDVAGSQVNSMSRSQNSFSHRSMGSRTSGGAGRR